MLYQSDLNAQSVFYNRPDIVRLIPAAVPRISFNASERCVCLGRPEYISESIIMIYDDHVNLLTGILHWCVDPLIISSRARGAVYGFSHDA